MSYVELHANSAFSFLRGASFPEQLAQVAAELEMPALGLLDRHGVYGSQRFSVAAREQKVRPIIGAELTMEDGCVLPVLVASRLGYANLCSLLTQAHLRSAVKGECAVKWEELPEFAQGLVVLFGLGSAGCQPAASGSLPDANSPRAGRFVPGLRQAAANSRLAACAPQTVEDRAQCLINVFGRENVYVEIQRHFLRGEDRINRALVDLASKFRLALIATNGVQYAKPSGRQVLDVFNCIREHTHLDLAGKLLTQNAERHLKSDAEMCAIFRDLPDAITNTERLAERLEFLLQNIGYEFPEYPVPDGHTMNSFLRTMVLFGAQQRYESITKKVKRQLEEELALITRLGFAGYFLIVWDIVNFCRENNIMVQGRGSAANSAVCFCLGITPVDPVSNHLVFERFLNESRKGWPDIDLDLPSGDRRERVIQEIYRRYGKHGAAMTANVISYRGRSAAREIGKALNFSPSVIDRFSHLFASGDFPHTLELEAQIEQAGLPKAHPRMPAFISLYRAIYGLPRLQPKCFYDVVIEVAIIRPGPIQGDMVHPYLARRAGKEEIAYFDERLKPVLDRTLGVPLFQEQMLKIAMIMANFSGDEAEELRRALSFHRSEERMNRVSIKLREAMARNNVAPDVIEKVLHSITSFALYGFPESHAISFAILDHGYAYLNVHRPPDTTATLINNQPMGFYTPATIVKDAQRHRVKVKPVCVNNSDWRCTVLDDDTFRLGFCVVNGLRQQHGEKIERARQDRQFASLEDFKQWVS